MGGGYYWHRYGRRRSADRSPLYYRRDWDRSYQGYTAYPEQPTDALIQYQQQGMGQPLQQCVPRYGRVEGGAPPLYTQPVVPVNQQQGFVPIAGLSLPDQRSDHMVTNPYAYQQYPRALGQAFGGYNDRCRATLLRIEECIKGNIESSEDSRC